MSSSVDSAPSGGKGKRLLDQMRDVMRVKHYSVRTEQTYCDWVERFIRFHRLRHPRELGEPEVAEFLTHLARKYPSAEREWCWQWVFPSSRLSVDPRGNEEVDSAGETPAECLLATQAGCLCYVAGCGRRQAGSLRYFGRLRDQRRQAFCGKGSKRRGSIQESSCSRLRRRWVL